MPSPDLEAGGAQRARHLLKMSLTPSPAVFGEYELLTRIGRGATSEVHRARRTSDDQSVALKVMHDADAASDREVSRFLDGAALGAALDHPNIVRVLDFGDHDGVPFIAMSLVEGRNLKQVIDEARPSPAEAARIMATIARAVDHAHDRGVVHRDLKPANVLVDQQGVPHVADFGLARRLDQQATGSQGQIVGTLAYMAPEQAAPQGTPTTFAADIFSLGVIFYELLTGRSPFPAESVDEVLTQLRSADPVPPRSLDRSVGVGHQNVCLKCLDRDPARRYRSAGALADDLDRLARGEPTEARMPSVGRRALRWARRHPRVRAGLIGAAAVALVVGALVLSSWRTRAREEARQLDTNAFIASGQAGAVLFQLRAYADRVEKAARHPLVTSLLTRGQVVDPAPRELAGLAAGFDSLFLMDAAGRVLTDWPSTAPEVFQRNYAFRDYFRGARRLAETGEPGAYVARAYRSESRGRLEFALSAPVRGADGRQIGLVVAPLHSKAAFGNVRLQEHVTGGRIITALLGPRGNERPAGPDGPRPPDYTFLVHPGLDLGAEFPLRAPGPAHLRQAFGAAAAPGEQFVLQATSPLKVADFRDPIPGFPGRWLAAFAPVGQTGYVVMIATPAGPVRPWARL